MQVMKMVVSSGLPFRFVNNSYFRRFVKEVQRYKAEYTPPSDFPLRTTLLDKTYEQVAADLQVLLPLSIFIIFSFSNLYFYNHRRTSCHICHCRRPSAA